jgi:hypothetical protein
MHASHKQRHSNSRKLAPTRWPPGYTIHFLHRHTDIVACSAAVQWYARSGQLPTADGMKHKGQGEDIRSRMGCREVEDPHHVLVSCKCKHEENASEESVKNIRRRIESIGLGDDQFIRLIKTVRFIFSECTNTLAWATLLFVLLSMTYPEIRPSRKPRTVCKQTQTRKIPTQCIKRLVIWHISASHLAYGATFKRRRLKGSMW